MKPAQNRHISIIGTSIGSRDIKPRGEVWGLAWHHDKGFDRLFEMHDFRYYSHLKRGYPKDIRHKLYMLPKQAKKYGCVPYPLARVRGVMGGRNYFTSTLAYMLALAIYEEVDEITVLGVDLVQDGEYAYQRPCAEYLVGFARGRGLKVNIPKTSALCRHSFVYGQERPKQYGAINGEAGEVIEYLDNQISLVQREGHKGNPKYMEGVTDAFRATKDAINEATRGADMSRLGEIK